MPFTPIIALSLFLAGDDVVRMQAAPKNAQEFYVAYKRYGLWLPPKDTKLVRWVENQIWNLNTGLEERKIVHLELLTRPASEKGPALVRERTSDYPQHRRSRLTAIAPNPSALEGLPYRDSHEWLRFTAAAQHLGWSELANESFKQFVAPNYRDPWPTLTALRYMAWEFHYESLFDSETDRAAALKYLKLISEDDARFRSSSNTALIEDLELTICESGRKKSGIEKVFDELCDIQVRRLNTEWPAFNSTSAALPSTAFEKLCQEGYDAVPHLIRHLDDRRVTRRGDLKGFNNFLRVDVVRVGNVCYDILRNLSNDEFKLEGDETPEEMRLQAERWWAKAKKIGEEKWAVDHAVGQSGPNFTILQLLAAKYPTRLVEAYRKALKDSPEAGSDLFVGAVLLANMAKEDKVKLLQETSNHKEIKHHRSALEGLRLLDKTAFTKSLLKFQERLARGTGHTSRPGAFLLWGPLLEEAGWVKDANDPECWAAFRKALAKEKPLDRIEFLDYAIDLMDLNNPVYSQHLMPILQMLWEDTTKRHGKDARGFPFPFYEYPDLTVGDAVTLRVADLLDIDIPWDRNRSPAEWTKLREKVQAALAEARKK